MQIVHIWISLDAVEMIFPICFKIQTSKSPKLFLLQQFHLWFIYKGLPVKFSAIKWIETQKKLPFFNAKCLARKDCDLSKFNTRSKWKLNICSSLYAYTAIQ